MRWLAVFVVLLAACDNPPPPPLPSTPAPRPTFVFPTRSPSPSPSAPAARLGIVYAVPGNRPVIAFRMESDPEPFGSVDGGHYPVISPDGRRMAYWRRDSAAGPTAETLKVIELIGGQELEIVTLQNELSGGIAWRDDGQALVFAATSPTTLDTVPAQPAIPTYTALRTIEVGARVAREVRRFDHERITPLGWNSTTHVIVGQDAPDGRLLTLFRVKDDGSNVSETGADQRFQEIVDVTRDSRQVLAQFNYTDSGKIRSGIRMVAGDTSQPVAERELPQGSFVIRSRFRPSTTDVVALVSAPDTGRYALEIWGLSGTAPAKRVWTSGASATTTGELVLRVDGKAAYVRTDQASSSSWQTIDLDTGNATPFALGTSPGPGGPGFFSDSFFITDAAVAKLRR